MVEMHLNPVSSSCGHEVGRVGTHRSCYVNFAEHLQNRWNVNVLYPGAPNEWSLSDWTEFLTMIKGFGYTCFEFWLVPTLYDRPALIGSPVHQAFAKTMQEVIQVAKRIGLQTKYICPPNSIGPEWYYACPNDPTDRKLIRDLWRFWSRELTGIDIVGIFPGDPGGCNRNGCTHETFLELALELIEITKEENPGARFELGTWGTPFSGWGTDLRSIPNWDGTWEMLLDPAHASPETPAHIWNGDRDRARVAMEHLIANLHRFPKDMIVAINLGFNPDGEYESMGGDARPWAKIISETNEIVTWDYSLAEGELVTYPHWRLPRMITRRSEERAAAPYSGGINYTMSPKLNQLSLYAGAKTLENPNDDPNRISREFCSAVFGDENARLGDLFEAFEIVHGWGHYPRRTWTNPELIEAFEEMITLLKRADMTKCTLQFFPTPEQYREDILWFAGKFLELVRENPDRVSIRREYWNKALHIYDQIPMSTDERAEEAANRFAAIQAITEPEPVESEVAAH